MEGTSGFFVLDSSVWVALFIDGDSQHTEALDVIDGIVGFIYIPYTVISEVATVLTNKYSKDQADTFLQFILHDSRCVLIDNQHSTDITAFLDSKETLSFPDISIVTLALQHRAELITFDRKMRAFSNRNRI